MLTKTTPSKSLLALSLVTAFFALNGCNKADNHAAPAAYAAAPAAQTAAPAEESAPVAPREETLVAQAEEENFPAELYQDRKMQSGQMLMDVMLASPDRANTRQGALTIFTCQEEPLYAANSEFNGIGILSGSRVVVKRDLQYNFGDGSRSSGLVPNSLIECGGSVEHRTREWAKSVNEILPDSQGIQERKLKDGDAVMEVLLHSPGNAPNKATALVFVTCAKNLKAASNSGINGIVLSPGSQIVVARDLDYQFGDGSNSANLKRYSVISCE